MITEEFNSHNEKESSSRVKFPTSKKKRIFSEIVSDSTLQNELTLDIIKEYKCVYPSKKKRLIDHNNKGETINIDESDYEILRQIQNDLQNLKLRNHLHANNQKIEEKDMPEITNIVNDIEFNLNDNNDDGEYKITSRNCIEQQLDLFKDDKLLLELGEPETSDNSISLDNEIPFLYCEDKISKKFIINAVETEKMFNKLFRMYNPKLQPNANNGIMLYKDMVKLKEKIRDDMLINLIVESINSRKEFSYNMNLDRAPQDNQTINYFDDMFID